MHLCHVGMRVGSGGEPRSRAFGLVCGCGEDTRGACARHEKAYIELYSYGTIRYQIGARNNINSPTFFSPLLLARGSAYSQHEQVSIRSYSSRAVSKTSAA